jgi:hypothetical protein
MSRDQVVVAREASSGNLLRANSAVTRFPVKSPPCAATITTPIPNLASHVSFNDGLLAADIRAPETVGWKNFYAVTTWTGSA